MHRKRFPTIAVAVCICLVLLGGSLVGIFSVFSGFGKVVTLPFVSLVFDASRTIPLKSSVSSLVLENKKLRSQLVGMQQLVEDNKALHDQFAITTIRSSNLLPAHIVGAPTFLPGFTQIETLIIDKGSKDGLKIGQAVVYKDNLIGNISKVSPTLAVVQTVTTSGSAFTAQTSNGLGTGVIKGQGLGHMLLDNVTLSEKLEKSDTIITKGDINEKGQGYPPHLLVGKITGVNNKPSALFQTADVVSLVSFADLRDVFVLIHYE